MSYSYTITRANNFYVLIDSTGNELSVAAPDLETAVVAGEGNTFFWDGVALDYTECSNISASSPLDIVAQILALTG